MIGAVIFDFDGLILDTEVPIFTAWREAFDHHGAELTLDDWAAEIGTIGGLDLMGLLHERASRPVDVDAMHERRRARNDELLEVEMTRPGVHAWLDDADALGLPCAIASSSDPLWVETHLDRLGLRRRFAHLACARDGLRPKPAPDTYQAACDALGVVPGDAIAVEDSPHGIRAAKLAGLRCVAVPNAITAELDLSQADLEVRSLATASLREVLELLGD